MQLKSYVRDVSGRGVIGAEVELLRQGELEPTESLVTSNDGDWESTNLPPGAYRIRTSIGSSRQTREPDKAVQFESVVGLDGETAPLSAESIDGDQIRDEAVSGDKIAAGSITGEKIADGAIEREHFDFDVEPITELPEKSVDGSLLKDGSVTGDKIPDGSIAADRVHPNVLYAVPSNTPRLSAPTQRIAPYGETVRKRFYIAVRGRVKVIALGRWTSSDPPNRISPPKINISTSTWPLPVMSREVGNTDTYVETTLNVVPGTIITVSTSGTRGPTYPYGYATAHLRDVAVCWDHPVTENRVVID